MKRFLILLSLLTMLVACDALPSSQTGSPSNEAPIEQAGLSPQEVMDAFMTAWQAEDFATMHALLSPRSVEIYPYEEFEALYNETHRDITFTGIRYDVHDVQEQGNSAAIHYDIVLETEGFAEIEDNGRTLRLVRDGNLWEIAWSPMDIINGMNANVILRPIRVFSPRGNIYDRNNLPLVQENGITMGLRMLLSDMLNREDCTALLSRIMLRPSYYFNRLYIDYQAFDTAFYVGEIDSESYNDNRGELERLCGTNIDIELIGSKVVQSLGRSYFGSGAAAHITGYFGSVPAENLEFWRNRGYSDRDLVGLAGIEYAYQDVLAGTPRSSLQLIDSTSNVILRTLGTSDGTPSNSVQLTIDRDLQEVTARAFIDAWEYAGQNWVTRATGGAAVVMDVNSGAVLSMFSFPTYDPRIFYPESTYYQTSTTYAFAASQIQRATTSDGFSTLGPAIINRAYTEQYSPGSVFKIISTLAAIDSGAWDVNEQFDCQLLWENGSIYGDSQPVREDWRLTDEWEPAGMITLQEALTTSCNPFFWEVGAKMFLLSPDTLFTYASRFGFGQRTGLIGFSAEREAQGILPQAPAMDVALNNVIGQGNTQVSVLQMARLVSAVANGGTLYRPYLVSQVGGYDGTDIIETIEPEVTGMLDVSDEAWRTAYDGMCNVPSDEDLGTSYDVFNGNEFGRPNYTSCGKTGTAEAGSAPNAWYVAFAPAENPQIAVVVVVPNSRHGSEVSAPITRRIMDYYFGSPIVNYPRWWEDEYNPVEPPTGISGE